MPQPAPAAQPKAAAVSASHLAAVVAAASALLLAIAVLGYQHAYEIGYQHALQVQLATLTEATGGSESRRLQHHQPLHNAHSQLIQALRNDASFVAASEALIAPLHIARLTSTGTIHMPESTRHILIEIGCSDRVRDSPSKPTLSTRRHCC